MAAAESGELDRICERRGVALLSVFGSTERSEGRADDLDVGVRFVDEPDQLGLLDELVQLTSFDRIDLAVLDRAGPVLRAEAFSGTGLYENERGAFARAQMAAFAERRDTDWLRQLSLETMAQ